MKPLVRLSDHTLQDFVSVLLSAVNAVQEYKVCCGIDSPALVCEWLKHKNCRLDENNFLESSYDKTLRTFDCDCLIGQRKVRCESCGQYLTNASEREQRRSDEVKPQTLQDYLSPRRLKIVLQRRKKTVRNQAARLKYQAERIAELLEKESHGIDEDLHKDLSGVLDSSTGFVKSFWEEQKRATLVKKGCGMRWHPFLLRWALHIKSISMAAYRAMRDSGIIKFPSERTLYEYSYANPTEEGIQESVAGRLAEAVMKFDDDFKTYFVLMMDEMYIFRNVVYRKGIGDVVGYVKLDDVETEMLALQKELDGEKDIDDIAPVASTVLTFLAKGVGNGLRGITACFTAAGLNVDQLDSRVWQVVERLEVAGLKIIVIVGDGHPVNRAFFNRHPPFSGTEGSKVVYATLNVFANDERPIFFINDVRHLLKTARNCFSNSGAHKNSRILTKNGQVISWKTIISLYKSEEVSDLWFCPKLSAMHVFLDSYSVMRVYLAAQVMSRTVAAYIEQHYSPSFSETVKFIRYINDFFDCLNGAHSSEALKTNNDRLAPYTSVDDPRFVFLREFLTYLKEWEEEIDQLEISDEEKKRRLLSRETLEGIERTVKGFEGFVKYVLPKRKDPKEGFIMARIVEQDSLEHYFGDQRMCGGGNRHPTVARFLENQNMMEAKGTLGLRAIAGRNCRKTKEPMDASILNEPLPKRPKPEARRSLHLWRETEE